MEDELASVCSVARGPMCSFYYRGRMNVFSSIEGMKEGCESDSPDWVEMERCDIIYTNILNPMVTLRPGDKFSMWKSYKVKWV